VYLLNLSAHAAHVLNLAISQHLAANILGALSANLQVHLHGRLQLQNKGAG
jgi:hypothetical protein